jgi:hypothetical protein
VGGISRKNPEGTFDEETGNQEIIVYMRVIINDDMSGMLRFTATLVGAIEI